MRMSFGGGKRGETEIKGVSFNTLYGIVRNKLEYYHPGKADPDAFCQDMCCEIEKRMGIFPNCEPLTLADIPIIGEDKLIETLDNFYGLNKSTVRTLELDRAEQEALDNS